MFDKLFRRDPTRKFERSIFLPLSLDLRKGALGDIVMGQHLDKLAPLGPASTHNSVNKGHHNLEYADLGMSINIIDDHIDSMVFPITSIETMALGDNFKAASVRIRSEGLTITGTTREEDLEPVFGAPSLRDIDDECKSLQYDIDRCTYEFDFSPDGQLQVFSIYITDYLPD